MARLSTTDCKRLENAIVGAHILAGRTGSQEYGRLRGTEFPG